MYKNVAINDLNIEGKEEKVGDLVSIQFFPQQSTVPLLEGDFWAELREDIPNRALHLKIVTKEMVDSNLPYIARLSLFSSNKVNFEIDCSPYASGTEHLKLLNVIQKIQGLDYRRLYIDSDESEKLIVTSCPSINTTLSKERKELVEQIADLEEKLNTRLTVPLDFDHKTMDFVISLNKMVDSLNKEDMYKCIQEYEKKISNPKTTLINVELISTQKDLKRNLIMHQLGWLKYSSFGVNLNRNKVYEWNQIIKRQDPIEIVTNVRGYNPNDFFNTLFETVKNSEFFNSFFKLLDVNTNLSLLLESKIEIVFNEPKDNIQLVNIKITDIDEDWNRMESLVREKDYINLIPILEKFGNDNATLAYCYALNQQYNEAIDLANSVIKQDIRSVAHLTRGLAYVGKGEYKMADEAYRLGVNICGVDWYPEARDNLVEFIKNNNIPYSEEITNIVKLLGAKRTPINLNKRCYCGSKKNIKKCHANLKNFN